MQNLMQGSSAPVVQNLAYMRSQARLINLKHKIYEQSGKTVFNINPSIHMVITYETSSFGAETSWAQWKVWAKTL